MPQQEQRAWYQYYFCTPRGAAGLTENRRDIAKLLWQLWLVGEPFDAATVRGERGVVRQSGFCRGGDSLLPGALRLRGRRSLARRHRDAACRKAADHRAGHCSARRSGRSRVAVIIRRSCEAFHRARISAGWCRAPATRCRRMHRGTVADAVLELARSRMMNFPQCCGSATCQISVSRLASFASSTN